MIEGLRIFFQVFLIGSRLAITEHTNNQPFVITPSYLSFLFAGREEGAPPLKLYHSSFSHP
jgi:hypothetical protein